MTYEKAIDYVLGGAILRNPSKDRELRTMIIEALEKQVPAVPYKVGIDEYECPIKTCRGKLIKGYPCKCGKCINWSDEE